MPRRRSERFGTPQNFSLTDANNLSGLPLDILGEIVSHLPEPLVVPPQTREGLQSWVPVFHRLPRNSECFQKIDTLRALSVTCKSLRAFALPLAWERIDVRSSKFSIHNDDPRANKDLSSQLFRQLTIATSKKNGIAQFVRNVNLELIREASSEKGLSRLAKALAAFSNLHTIQMTESSCRKGFSLAAFEGKVFPNVKKLVISKRLLPLLECCPSTTYVDISRCFLQDDDIAEYTLRHLNRNVEEFVAFQALFGKSIERFGKVFRGITVINLFEDGMFRDLIPIEEVIHLKGLPNLQCVRFFAQGPYESLDRDSDSIYSDDEETERAIEVYNRIIETLRSLPSTQASGKHICSIVTIQDVEGKTHDVISGECPRAYDCRFWRETPRLLKEVW